MLTGLHRLTRCSGPNSALRSFCSALWQLYWACQQTWLPLLSPSSKSAVDPAFHQTSKATESYFERAADSCRSPLASQSSLHRGLKQEATLPYAALLHRVCTVTVTVAQPQPASANKWPHVQNAVGHDSIMVLASRIQTALARLYTYISWLEVKVSFCWLAQVHSPTEAGLWYWGCHRPVRPASGNKDAMLIPVQHSLCWLCSTGTPCNSAPCVSSRGLLHYCDNPVSNCA